MKFTGIQMLRFAAAMLVAVMHITQAVSMHLSGQGPGQYWAQGSVGVDIFFVISGFVMGITTPPSGPSWRERAQQTWQFLQRRLIRVLPLYWFYTVLKVALLTAVPALALRTSLDGAHLAASLLFVPWPSPWGRMEPVLPVGWTLNFEMLFYALFALAVLLRLPRLASCLGLLGLLVLAAHAYEGSPLLSFWGSSIVLEFVLGVALARLHQRRLPVTPEAGLLALCLGLLWIFALPWTAQDDRLLSWGLGAALVVAGVLWLEPWAARVPGAASLAFLGDASYSLYLSHTFVVPAGARAAAELGWTQPLAVGLLLAAAVVLAGCLSYVMLERPMTHSLARRLMRRPPSTDATSKTSDTAATRPFPHAP
jgi:exopolysaccharide production protein ExoZ